ncbi:DUF3159 domain-containing protein [Streptomyces microflavus]|uniref:DUF3159 domain-containing protein n=1 Tax=Streptomyces microflavus TaxID=1919 RepID=A0ABV1Q293_STRMI|nr:MULTISPECIES: DUF3159 domain-containing protein [Streptomyces]MEE1731517.1 DUF3159 domain-containing protein [Streptomyces sp. BE282]WTF72550.1 DUF3159 domain-containing protein [Streptomyces microflavus]
MPRLTGQLTDKSPTWSGLFDMMPGFEDSRWPRAPYGDGSGAAGITAALPASPDGWVRTTSHVRKKVTVAINQTQQPLNDGRPVPDPAEGRTAIDSQGPAEAATGLPGQPERAPRQRPSALEQAGGVRGVIYSALPVLAFVIGNALGGLTTAIIAALALAVVIAAERLIRKESVVPAVGGVFGVAVAAGISWWTGSAKDYFLIGIWSNLALALVFGISVLAGRPLAGVLWFSMRGKRSTWRDDRRARRYFGAATIVLAVIFAARFVVQQYLYQADEVGSLGTAKILMGYPLLAVGVLVVAWAARAASRRSPEPTSRQS